jgi:hypothetical protein
MDASFRWHDDGFYNWVSNLTHYRVAGVIAEKKIEAAP